MKKQLLALIFITSLTNNFYAIAAGLGQKPTSGINLAACSQKEIEVLRKALIEQINGAK